MGVGAGAGERRWRHFFHLGDILAFTRFARNKKNKKYLSLPEMSGP
jgi:hypothetical protein